jgi:hypothetical protein
MSKRTSYTIHPQHAINASKKFDEERSGASVIQEEKAQLIWEHEEALMADYALYADLIDEFTEL